MSISVNRDWNNTFFNARNRERSDLQEEEQTISEKAQDIFQMTNKQIILKLVTNKNTGMCSIGFWID